MFTYLFSYCFCNRTFNRHHAHIKAELTVFLKQSFMSFRLVYSTFAFSLIRYRWYKRDRYVINFGSFILICVGFAISL